MTFIYYNFLHSYLFFLHLSHCFVSFFFSFLKFSFLYLTSSNTCPIPTIKIRGNKLHGVQQ